MASRRRLRKVISSLCGLTKKVGPSVSYRSHENAGMGLKESCDEHKRRRVIRCHPLATSKDPRVKPFMINLCNLNFAVNLTLISLSRKDLNSVTMIIMEWLWKSICFSQLLCKRVIAIRWTFIPLTGTARGEVERRRDGTEINGVSGKHRT